MGPYCWTLALPLLLGAAQDELPANWKVAAPKDAGFSAKMPGTPTEKKQQVKTATGQLSVTLYIAEGRNESLFVVSYTDYSEADLKKAPVDKRLDQARDGAVEKSGGKLRGEKKIELDGQPGREIVIENNGEVIAKMRIYLVQRRLYQVMVLGNEPTFKSKDVGTFLDSFRVIK